MCSFKQYDVLLTCFCTDTNDIYDTEPVLIFLPIKIIPQERKLLW